MVLKLRSPLYEVQKLRNSGLCNAGEKNLLVLQAIKCKIEKKKKGIEKKTSNKTFQLDEITQCKGKNKGLSIPQGPDTCILAVIERKRYAEKKAKI